ncbi:MAG: plastocyanin/azurin family copper-binding protein [Capsulimonadaceae bacterium]
MRDRVAFAALAVVVIAVGLLEAGCTGGASRSIGTPPPGQTSVAVVNDASAPMGYAFTTPVTVKSGIVVTWVNKSSAPHSVAWDAHTPASSPGPGANLPVFQPGSSSSAWTAPAVTTSTTYNYHCTIHTSMLGVITVTP